MSRSQACFLLALRYWYAKKTHNVINVISAISSIGMAVGTAALILILGIFNGFNQIIENNISDLNPDIKISRNDSHLFDLSLPVFDYLYEYYIDVRQVLEQTVFVNYNERQAVAKVKGVDHNFENNDTRLSNHIVSGESALHFGELPLALLGVELAQTLGVNTRFSQKIELYYPSSLEENNLFALNLNCQKILPKGLFSISSDVDKELIILPISVLRDLLAQPIFVSSLELTSDNTSKEVLDIISEKLGSEYKVENRQMQNKSLFQMMQYEKLALYAILLFVIVIISFNIYACQSMLCLEKKNDIFYLFSFGFREKDIRRVFVYEGFLSSLAGVVAGLFMGLLLAFIQIKFGIFKMPSGFVLSAYPCILNFNDILLTFVSVSLIAVLISLLFSLKIATFAAEK